MTISERPALLVPMMDLPLQFEDETNLWFDFDHIPERLSCEGMLSCRRLELSPVAPAGATPEQRWMKHLVVYSVASMEVFGTRAYALGRELNGGAGSVWRQLREARQDAVGATRPRALRTTWVERSVHRGPMPLELPAPRVCLIHLRPDAVDLDDEVNHFVDEQLVPELLNLPGFLGCQRYEAAIDENYAARSQATAGMSQPRYMDVFEVATAEVPASGPFRGYLQSLDSMDPRIRQAWTPVGIGTYVQRPSPWLLSAGSAEVQA